MKPAQRNAQAQTDIEAALACYQSEAPHMAGNFLNALEKVAGHVQRAPGTGSPRHAHALEVPGLRFWLLGKFPYAFFTWSMRTAGDPAGSYEPGHTGFASGLRLSPPGFL